MLLNKDISNCKKTFIQVNISYNLPVGILPNNKPLTIELAIKQLMQRKKLVPLY